MELMVSVVLAVSAAAIGKLLPSREDLLRRSRYLFDVMAGRSPLGAHRLPIRDRLLFGTVLVLVGALADSIPEEEAQVAYLLEAAREGSGNGRRQVLGLAASTLTSPAALSALVLVAVLLDFVAAVALAGAGAFESALGHLAAPWILGALLFGLRGQRGLYANMPILGPAALVALSLRLLAVASLAAYLGGDGWSRGSTLAAEVGAIGLGLVCVAGLVPLHSWRQRRLRSISRWFVVMALPVSSVLGLGASIIELATFEESPSVLMSFGATVGAAAWVVAAAALAIALSNVPDRGLRGAPVR
jgi:hypothetical protein